MFWKAFKLRNFWSTTSQRHLANLILLITYSLMASQFFPVPNTWKLGFSSIYGPAAPQEPNLRFWGFRGGSWSFVGFRLWSGSKGFTGAASGRFREGFQRFQTVADFQGLRSKRRMQSWHFTHLERGLQGHMNRETVRENFCSLWVMVGLLNQALKCLEDGTFLVAGAEVWCDVVGGLQRDDRERCHSLTNL